MTRDYFSVYIVKYLTRGSNAFTGHVSASSTNSVLLGILPYNFKIHFLPPLFIRFASITSAIPSLKQFICVHAYIFKIYSSILLIILLAMVTDIESFL